AATVWVAFLTALRLFPKRPWRAVTAAAVVAFHPQMVCLSSCVNNDAGMTLAAALLWLFAVRVAYDGVGPRLGAAIGATAAVALLCKSNAAAAVLGVAVVGCGRALQHPGERRRTALAVATAAGVGLLASAPWLAWSWFQHGSLLGVDVHRDWWFAFLHRHGVKQDFLTFENAPWFIDFTWRSFWGGFGYCQTWLSGKSFLWIGRTSVAAGLGLIARGCFPRTGALRRRGDGVIAAAFLGGTAAAVALHASHSVEFGLAPQGRYLFSALIPILFAYTFGLAWFLESIGRRSLFCLIGAVTAAAGMAWIEADAIKAERRSNRVAQIDPQVRAELLGYGGAPMYSRGDAPDRHVVGEGSTADDRGALLACLGENAGVVLYRGPGVSGLVVEMECREGSPGGSRLVARSLGQEGGERTLPFQQLGRGFFRYRFDLSGVVDSGAGVELVLHPSDTECLVKIHRFQIVP
ncbi:MAG: glycosyltransferase family 39 protein, partial [Planctomycetia bacterium]